MSYPPPFGSGACPSCGRPLDARASTPEAYRAAPAPPLVSARYNLRAACLELILLERHLFDPAEHCDDCISKHLLTIEALALEGVSLASRPEDVASLRSLADVARELARLYRDGEQPWKLAQHARAIRKRLAPYCLDPREG